MQIPERALPELSGRSTNAIEDLRSARLSEKLASVGWRFASVLVLEIGVRIHTLVKPGVEALTPSGDLLRSEIFEAQASGDGTGIEQDARGLRLCCVMTNRVVLAAVALIT